MMAIKKGKNKKVFKNYGGCGGIGRRARFRS